MTGYFAGSDNYGKSPKRITRRKPNNLPADDARTYTGLWDINSQHYQHWQSVDGWPRQYAVSWGRTGSGTYNEGDTFSIRVDFTNRLDESNRVYAAFSNSGSATYVKGGASNDITIASPDADTAASGFIPKNWDTSGQSIAAGGQYDDHTATFDITVNIDYTNEGGPTTTETNSFAVKYLSAVDTEASGTMFNTNFATVGTSAIPSLTYYNANQYTFTNTINDTSQQAVSGTLNFSYYENRYGATIGTWEWYWCDTNGGNAQLLGTGSNANYGSATWLGPITIASGTSVTPNVGHVVCVYRTGTSFTGDLAFDDLTINGTTYSTSADWLQWSAWADQGPTTSGGAAGIVTAFSNDTPVVISTGASPRGWNIDQSNTPSSSTGPNAARSNTYYIYAETSAPNYSNKYLYLISPQITA